MSTIEIEGLTKSFGATPVLRGLNLVVPDGSVTAVLGASGSGKTTLLRIMAGFDDADSGRVTVGGQLLDDGQRTVSPQRRAIGYVPQDAALFPHLTVAANIGFGVARRQRAALVDLIDMVGLTGLGDRYPHQLSGGQQQRVALARALAIRPRVVLLDEPFGSLDAALRETVRADVMRILVESGTTSVLVTHDQDEALSVADHVALLEAGAIVAFGSPRELYERPASPEIARAIGTANILSGEVTEGSLRCGLGNVAVDSASADGPCTFMLRPEQLVISEKPDAEQVVATIRRVRFHGHDTLVDLVGDTADQPEFVARLAGEATLHAGQQVWLSVRGVPHMWS